MSKASLTLAARVAVERGRGWITTPLAQRLVVPASGPFLASWPRSGSTWLRTMLAHLMIDDYDSNPAVFNQFIPGTTLRNLTKTCDINPLKLRSTHSTYNRSVRKAVYLVRDIRQALPSFYRYTTTRIGRNIPSQEWVKLYLMGLYGPRWDQHVRSWLTRGGDFLGDQLLVIRYEDMKSHPVSELERVARFLDIPFEFQLAERAVELSSLETMRQWEAKTVGPLRHPNESFYRGEVVNEWESSFAEQDREKILLCSEDALSLAGYVCS